MLKVLLVGGNKRLLVKPRGRGFTHEVSNYCARNCLNTCAAVGADQGDAPPVHAGATRLAHLGSIAAQGQRATLLV